MKTITTLVVATGLVVSAAMPAWADEVSKEDVAKIMEVLSEIKCEMDEDDIEKSADGYELDDVFCEDGQFDIDLDNEFNVTSKKAE